MSEPGPGEQETLAGWSGWGAVPQIFDGRQEWTTENAQLRGLLSQQEYRRAEANTLNAHYTDPEIAAAAWEALRDVLSLTRGARTATAPAAVATSRGW